MSDKFIPKKNTGLGKGLSALIPGASLTREGTLKSDESAISNIAIHLIKPNPFQPRKEFDEQALVELRDSILQNGIIQPITVRRVQHGYELVAGERRFRASKMANLESLPAYVRDNISDEEMLEMAIIENVQRETLNPIELAQGYQQLIDVCHLTQEDVAVKIGKDRTTVANILRLLKLPGPIQDSLRKEEITIGHGRALIALPGEAAQLKAWKEVVTGYLSVRKTEQLVKHVLDHAGQQKKTTPHSTEKDTTPPASETNPHIAAIEDRLRIKLGTKVRIRHRSDGGSLEIEYYSNDDLERLLELIDSIRV